MMTRGAPRLGGTQRLRYAQPGKGMVFVTSSKRPSALARRRLVLAVLVATSAAATLIAPAGAGEATVAVAPAAAPPGTAVTLTLSPAEACARVVYSFTMADSRVALAGSSLLAWSGAIPATMPPPPAEATEVPADGYRLFVGVGCIGADGNIASVACAPLRLLPAGVGATGSETATFVAGTELLDSDRSLSKCERENAVPTVLIPGQVQSIIGLVNTTWYVLLSPVAATTTTSTTQLPVPVTTPTTVPPAPTTTAPP